MKIKDEGQLLLRYQNLKRENFTTGEMVTQSEAAAEYFLRNAGMELPEGEEKQKLLEEVRDQTIYRVEEDDKQKYLREVDRLGKRNLDPKLYRRATEEEMQIWRMKNLFKK